MSSFWPSSTTSEFQFLGTKLTIDSYSFDSSTPWRLQLELVSKHKIRRVLYCASEPRGEEYETSGMYWRVLDDEEAAAY